ncbi:MAG: ABC transporter ATP-binding protein [Candidatus Bipolaricaulota bacterium]|nr:ABC transporter ATP-binding protein [Candidatus Bipolaricaulota bacterium]MCS7273869.1 ABC transporter ATP-binding protein [Candidatus Bipolaricaulota bacterium]MDW8110713.1 ABC transporter ATP-binding protein [Candidatus Bipolaricaulota bacterium]MDW8328429.1 ABC transporter ATP-binding protein [Candidatus Bipolaricaulota bacterium]
MLKVEGLHAGYGHDLVLRGLSLEVRPGEVVGLLGRNGMGKSTALKSILRLTDLRAGSIQLDGDEISRLSPFQIARRGIAYLPQESKVFPDLTVREHLLLVNPTMPSDIRELHALFSRLQERLDQRAGTLSGGEQQMLALARVLLARPRYALLDEPMEGLMGPLLPTVATALRALKAHGVGVLLAEQSPSRALRLCDRLLVIDKGRIVAEYISSVEPTELRRALAL